jgi:hypothetical protein
MSFDNTVGYPTNGIDGGLNMCMVIWCYLVEEYLAGRPAFCPMNPKTRFKIIRDGKVSLPFGVACEQGHFGDGKEGQIGSGDARGEAVEAAAAAVVKALARADAPLLVGDTPAAAAARLQVRTDALRDKANFVDTPIASVPKLGRHGRGTIAIVDGLIWMLSRPAVPPQAA